MDINRPDIVAEVRAAFDAYEAALLANDNVTLQQFFLDDPRIVRYGIADIQHGHTQIARFRSTQAPFQRRLRHLVITTFGTDFATASTQFERADCPGEVGRQMQSWVRIERDWKIVAAHVSMMPEID
jgi:ketosteroid isomerase-like protein